MSDRVPAGFYETIVHWSLPGQSGDIITSFGWDGHDAADPPVFEDVVSAINQLLGNLSNQCAITGVTFDLGSSAADNPTHESSDGNVGLSSGTPMPANCAALIQKRGALGGRRNRGRFYLPGITKTGVEDDGSLNSTYVGSLQTNVDGMLGDQAANSDTPVVFHQSAPFTPTNVGVWTVQPKIATQRTRLRD